MRRVFLGLLCGAALGAATSACEPCDSVRDLGPGTYTVTPTTPRTDEAGHTLTIEADGKLTERFQRAGRQYVIEYRGQLP